MRSSTRRQHHGARAEGYHSRERTSSRAHYRTRSGKQSARGVVDRQKKKAEVENGGRGR